MKLLLVEDEIKTVDYLRRGLSENGYVVDTATNGVDGLHLARACSEPYDAIVLDVMLPMMDGVSLLKSLRREQLTPVLMLTARDDLDDRLNAFDAGADDYLSKPFSFLELLARLNVLTRRGRQTEPAQLTVGDLRIDLLSRRATRGTRRLDLSAREFTLLSVLARRQGQIVSKTAITELVWDISFDCNTNVVEVAVKRLRAKLDWPGEPKLLHTIRGMGYVMELRDGLLA
ncbi:heavy metal response regulator transcription factor [Cupriavidus sp. MP-37]|uniref:heavy metal response regulator transcription factor n=1 Tax=Cupriavidus sp. MP-37 TaxID=2884455 RepID=UPI001D0B036C|nr:heavy metal response regulator transcription factor [Cupriavidus sp. MP-37]UDM52949.1 heavy metal response regulator transcription factor [Cupriavidus sp. MP-37]